MRLQQVIQNGAPKAVAVAKRIKFTSDAFEAIHSAVASMAEAGTVDKLALREFDNLCLGQEIFALPEEVKHSSSSP